MLEQQTNSDIIMPSIFEKVDLNIIHRKKIMVVDDDTEFRIGICEILVDEGFLVTTAKNGDNALENLEMQTSLPDLILLDLIMPEKNGIEFRKQQLKTPGIDKIPVVFITGLGTIEGEICLMKPFDKNELLLNIKSII